MNDFRKRIANLCAELKAPKNLYNSFGKYSYRNAEGILEAVKPYLIKYEMMLTLNDTVQNIGDRYYVVATATLYDCNSEASFSVSANAREAAEKKGMDDSQITGTASSYARKYALNGLFLLDDTKDADSDENRIEREAKTEQKQAPADLNKLPIGEAQIRTIQGMCERKGIALDKILGKYKLKKLEDMSNEQFANCMVCLQKTADKTA